MTQTPKDLTVEPADSAKSRSTSRRTFLKGAAATGAVAAMYVAPKFSSVYSRPAYANVTGTCVRPLRCLDFEHDQDDLDTKLANGTHVTDQWSKYGICVSAVNTGGGPNIAMIIDSEDGASLAAAVDRDLGTPNEDFAGPGVGVGGESGAAGENNTGLSNLLIVAERSTLPPDDEAGGGSLIFDFSVPVDIQKVQVVDIDRDETNGVVCTTAAGTTGFAMAALGNNSVQTIDISMDDVTKLEVKFPSSGALASICFEESLCVLPEANQANCS